MGKGSLLWFVDYVDYVNYIVGNVFPPSLSSQQKKNFLHDIKYYFLEDTFLFRQCANHILRRCVPNKKIEDTLRHCHSWPYGVHFGGERTTAKVLKLGFIGLLFSRMSISLFQSVIDAKGLVTFLEDMRWLLTTFLR